MNKLTSFAALVAAALIGSLPESAWSNETPASEPATAAVQTPAPAHSNVPGWYPPPKPGEPVRTWQPLTRWPAPQQGYGQLPPRYPANRQYPAFPPAHVTARAAWGNPLSAELKQTQEQLTAKNSELIETHGLLEQLRGQLQDNVATESTLSDKIAYGIREQQALRVRVTELTGTLNTANATLEQQHQLINNHQLQNRQLTAERNQLHSELARRDEQLAALQSELQAATQALAQARSAAGTAGQALSAARARVGTLRDELTRLEAELGHQEARLQSAPQIRPE